MSEVPDRPHRTGFFWLDFLVAASAVIISVVSLFVAQRADRTQEQLLAASVWPYIEFDSSNLTPNNERRIVLTLRNAGVGPARVRWMTIDYHGTAMAGPHHLLHACCGNPKEAGALLRTLVTSTVSRTVLVPHESRDFILVKPNAEDEVAFDSFDHHRSDLRVRVCYCSVLGACWIMDNGIDGDPASVADCSPPRTVLFKG